MVHEDIVWHATQVTRKQRTTLTRVQPAVLWLTGLSGCGKSTLAMALEGALLAQGRLSYVLDGDNVRHGLNAGLTFSDADRKENIRRIGEVAKLFVDAGVLVITSFISPFRADREAVRGLLSPGEFIEVFVDAPLAVCESRDPKGLYQKARAALATGKAMQFTGLDSPYEPPLKPEIHLHSDQQTVDDSVATIMQYLITHGRLSV